MLIGLHKCVGRVNFKETSIICKSLCIVELRILPKTKLYNLFEGNI